MERPYIDHDFPRSALRVGTGIRIVCGSTLDVVTKGMRIQQLVTHRLAGISVKALFPQNVFVEGELRMGLKVEEVGIGNYFLVQPSVENGLMDLVLVNHRGEVVIVGPETWESIGHRLNAAVHARVEKTQSHTSF